MTDTELTLEKLANMLASGLPNLDEAGFIKLVAAARNHIEATAGEPKLEYVVKTGGDYSFEGVVVARFDKLDGKERVVVENHEGILHIFNPIQLSPSKQEVAGASENDSPSFEDIHWMIEEAFNRGLEAGAIWHDHEAETGGHCGESTSEKIIRQRRNAWHNDSATAIRALKNTGETEGERLCKQIEEMADSVGMKFTPDPEKVARFDQVSTEKTGMGELQRLGQEFDAAPDLSETEKLVKDSRIATDAEDRLRQLVNRFGEALYEKLVASERKYGWNEGWLGHHWATDLRRDIRAHVEKGDPRDVAAYCAFAWHHDWSLAYPAPSQQGDDVDDLVGRLEYRASKMHSDKADLMREAATALKTLKDERDKLEQRIFTECAASNSYAAECDSLSKKVEGLEDLLRDATFPTHGNWGGPLCSVKATYEDGSEASKGHEPNRNACAALAEEDG